MANIYQVLNSYHLQEGLDSEFLVIAENKEDAKEVCLRLLQEDQASHIESVKRTILDLEKSLDKMKNIDENDPNAFVYKRMNERNMENIVKFKQLLATFNGYKKECLTVNGISPRLKHGQVQFLEE